MFTGIREFFLGKNGGATQAEFERLMERDKFSDYLPWIYCDQESGEFTLLDNSYGYLWEVIPQYFMGETTYTAVENLLREVLPEGSVVQFILYSDSDVNQLIDQYESLKTRDDELVQKAVKMRADFLRKCTKGIDKMAGVPLRQFRAYLALKTYEPITKQKVANFEQNLVGANLGPRKVNAEGLMQWMRHIFNGMLDKQTDQISKERFLREQVISAQSTVATVDSKTLKLGRYYARCLTPKSCTEKRVLDPLKINALTGGWGGRVDDERQLTAPFMM